MIKPQKIPKSHQSYNSTVNDFAPKNKKFNSVKMMGNPNIETKRGCMSE